MQRHGPNSALAAAQREIAAVSAHHLRKAAAHLQRDPKPNTPDWAKRMRLATAERHLQAAEQVEREWLGDDRPVRAA